MRNVVVTGASRGIGLAIATTLAAGGYRVIAIARSDSPELRSAIAAGSAHGGAVSFRAFDLTDTAAIAQLVGEPLRHEFGPLYGLVNNAGIGTSGMLTLMRDEQIEALARLNTIAPIILTKYVLRSMMVERARPHRQHRLDRPASRPATADFRSTRLPRPPSAALPARWRREVGQLGITVTIRSHRGSSTRT